MFLVERSIMADSSKGSDIDNINDSDFNDIIKDDTGPDSNDIPDDLGTCTSQTRS